ncbi:MULTISPECIES: serine hydrolase [unclassified Oceanispirochaeta]|uniref:serine hydrolase domain-containing protein n=1 Tax=unclassified Oceanispirochaeta TaxID=2635722 RepID=UPI0011C06AFB|nr:MULTISPECIES: serine hydrolase [unclassified Oceanispirochaeta]MBF9017974.1 serine hydrolase [Oceanispirochaeta sp. M2]NPD74485.1 serine hydrolase [Oceanispirochaeta sp. M1]
MNKLYILLLSSMILISCGFKNDTGRDTIIWPSEKWHSSSPETQGVNSEVLAAMLEHIQQQEFNIDSIQIIRNGNIILDSYIHPYRESDLHIIHSCTKSITSLLIGIAIDQGLIESLDQPVLDFFPEKAANNKDEKLTKLTIRHLLTMSTGLHSRDSYMYRWEGLNAMKDSEEKWSEYILNLPFDVDPGSRFDYSNMASYLLSSIITESSGMMAIDFGNKYLFGPLGIIDILWPLSPEGNNIGWGEIKIHPHDLGRIGWMVLNKGIWKDQRIISEDYLNQATSAQVKADTLAEFYGFQWWVKKPGLFMALGYGGQYLIINPEKNLVVVFTSALKDKDFFTPMHLYSSFILKAIESDTALKKNKSSFDRLESLKMELLSPVEKIISNIPKEFQTFNGHKYKLNENPYNLKTIQYNFKNKQATLFMDFGNGIETYPVGLDGRYLINETEEVGVRGHWSPELKFETIFKGQGEAWWFDMKSVFYDESLHIVLRSSNGDFTTIEGNSIK